MGSGDTDVGKLTVTSSYQTRKYAGNTGLAQSGKREHIHVHVENYCQVFVAALC